MKNLQRLVLSAIFICFLGLVTGCGIGDTFEGTWVGVNRSVGFPQDMIVVRKVAKNGNGYVVSGKRIWLWNTTVTDKTAKLEWRERMSKATSLCKLIPLAIWRCLMPYCIKSMMVMQR